MIGVWSMGRYSQPAVNTAQTCLKIFVWSDEAVFHIGGFVNRHNCHYWAEEDPKMRAEKSKARSKVTVWSGMTSSQVVGPFILKET